MKKGFTLIELLAVIVLLAIIALIAVPIVLNIIGEVKQSSSVVNFKNIERTVKLYYATQKKSENIVFECENSVCKNGDDILAIKGQAPSQGKILIDKKGNIIYDELVINGYNCYKEQEKYVCSKDKIRKIFTDNTIIINTTKASELIDYKIYGNSIQEDAEVGDKTKNLLNRFNYPETTTINGITFTNNGDGTFTLNGTATDTAVLKISGNVKIGDGVTAYISGAPSGSSNSTYRIEAVYWGAFGEEGRTIESNTGAVNIRVFAGVTVNNLVFKPQIEIGSQKTDFEPYGYKIPVKVSAKNELVVNDAIHTGTTFQYTAKNGVITRECIINYVETSYLIQTTPFKEIIGTNTLEAGTYVWGIINSSGKAINNPYIQLSVNGETVKWYADTSITLEEKATINNFKTDYTGYNNGDIQQFEIIIEKGTELIEPVTTNIYLNEPLRCKDEKCDYIDFKNQKIIRNIEQTEDGTLRTLSDSKETEIKLPKILLNEGENKISIETEILPSRIELEYYK